MVVAKACANNCTDEFIAIKLPRCCGVTTLEVMACVGIKRPFENTKKIPAIHKTAHKAPVNILVIKNIGIIERKANVTKTGYFPRLSANFPTIGAEKMVRKPPTK